MCTSRISHIGSHVLLLLLAGIALFVTTFAFNSAMGNLHFIAVEQLVSKHQDSLTQDAVEALAKTIAGVERWSGDNPQYLLYLAQTERWMANRSDYSVKPNSIKQRLYQANQIRPTSAHQFVQLARESWLLGEDDHQVRQYLQSGQRLAPFDTRIALHSLDFYLSHWPALTLDEKVQTTRYLLNSQQYRITRQWKHLFRDEVKKQRACSLIHFNNASNEYCK